MRGGADAAAGARRASGDVLPSPLSFTGSSWVTRVIVNVTASPSGSVAVVVSPSVVLAVVGQVLERVPGGHGMVMVDAEAVNELITGGRFGRIEGSRLLR